MSSLASVDTSELFSLCAADPILYCQTFFPRTVRQSPPAFHLDFWQKLEDPSFDFFGAEVFRGGAKTTLCRLALSRRIAYALSRNILSVGVSEGMAVLTSRWLKKQIEFNTLWTQVFRLAPGAKWTDDYFEVKHGIEGSTIAVTAKGMTSGLRGLNLDDYRPDFIYCDDICNEENTATESGRKKIDDLIFGALVPSLAPKSEAPTRKFVLTNTAITKEDPIVKAHSDSTFRTVKYPKIVVEDGVEYSAWPSRWTLEECLTEKESYSKRRQNYIWLREYGCKIVGKGECAFNVNDLCEWTTLPPRMDIVIGIDPARSNRKRAHKSAILAWGFCRDTGGVYLLECFAQKGQNPEEIWTNLSFMLRKWRTKSLQPIRVGVETIAYQQMLAWYIRQKMQEEMLFFPILEIEDRRSKADRILQAYSGLASNGKILIHANHTEFRDAYEEYTIDVDIDILDAGAMAIYLQNPWMYMKGDTFDEEGNVVDPILEMEKGIPSLDITLGAP